MEQIKKQQIANALQKYAERYESQNKAAVAIGVSSATVSQIINGNWELIKDEMWRTVASAINFKSEKWEAVPTTDFQIMTQILADAKENALVMAITKASFRFVSGLHLPLDEVVERMNNSVSQGNTSEMFVTLFVGKLDLETGLLKYCNAGHNPIVVIDTEGNASFLPCLPNIAIGVFPDFKYKMQEISLKKGTRLVLYTDGVTEAERADKTQFGEKRLLQWAANPGTYPNAAEACNGLYQVVKDFVEGNEQNDDITIMTIKYK